MHLDRLAYKPRRFKRRARGRAAALLFSKQPSVIPVVLFINSNIPVIVGMKPYRAMSRSRQRIFRLPLSEFLDPPLKVELRKHMIAGSEKTMRAKTEREATGSYLQPGGTLRKSNLRL